MAIDLTVSVNGEAFSNYSIRVTDAFPAISWSRGDITLITADGSGGISTSGVIDQYSYEFRLGTLDTGIGTDAFVGDLIATGPVYSEDMQYRYDGDTLERGFEYYGQIRVSDESGDLSGWKIFKFTFNSVPTISTPVISPISPTTADDLTVDYAFLDPDGDLESGTKIRWYRNGVHERIFDNQITISNRDTDLGDVWFCDVFPGDGYENGVRRTASSVAVMSPSLSLASGTIVNILPENPNENDILKASYRYEIRPEEDQSIIRWYVNNVIQSEFNDNRCARPRVVPGDVVKVEVTEYDGSFQGQTFSSEEVVIAASDFSVYNIRIDGMEEPLSLLARRPLVTWNFYKPSNVEAKYASIFIGTYWGGHNVYSTIISTAELESFRIPESALDRGRDYYISIAISDTQTFGKYTTSHFRTAGSLWREQVDNSTGWTIQAGFIFQEIGTFDIDEFHTIRIQDGTRFAEVRIYADRVGLYSSTLTLDQSVNTIYDFTKKTHTLTVVGSGDDILVYLDNELEIDGTGLMTQGTTSKALSFGKPLLLEEDQQNATDLTIRYTTFDYTVNGNYAPSAGSVYQDLAFYHLADFESESAVGLSTRYTVGLGNEEDEPVQEIYHLVATNSFDDMEGGNIYSIIRKPQRRYTTARRTFVPINRIKGSPNTDYAAFAHSRGSSIFKNYPLFFYNYSIDMTTQLPTQNNWELYQNIGKQVAGISDGRFEIDTTYARIGDRWKEEEVDYFPGDLDSQCSDCPEYSMVQFDWEDLVGGDYDYDDQEVHICSFSPCSDLTFTQLGTDSSGKPYYRIDNYSGSNLLLSFFSSYGTAALSHRYIFYQTQGDGSGEEVLFDTDYGVSNIGFCNANIMIQSGKRLRVKQLNQPVIFGGLATQNGYHDELDTNGRVRCVLTPCT